ncbi:hypothetical protein J2X45_002900 [Caulobacter sp. BE264]|uniref:DUF1176 domain-containing protein n=1 Tax=Caulobacter sp. BE264 TaxID=2817724 RepID=UPI002858C681|nr:DUF1176 domain-containing protein [Caulobacter sp. BE264]MDR7231797.1 hypothetical protein [Caulobacter sp. BE264]
MLEIILAAAVTAVQIGDLDTHRLWSVACDNQHVCHATTPHAGARSEKLEIGAIAQRTIGLAIHRDPGANAAPYIRFLPCDLCTPDNAPDPTQVRELAVLDTAGRPIFRLQLNAREARRANTPAGLAFPADSGLFLAMAVGETLDFGDTSLQSFAKASLRGARDALRAMDMNQLRSGAVTALLERGGRKIRRSARAKYEAETLTASSPGSADPAPPLAQP